MKNEQLYLAETITDYINTQKLLSERDKRTLAYLRNDAVCADSPIGEYSCQVEIRFSVQSERKSFSVDTCLQPEIHELIFKRGINTIGCCCGHGRKQAYIQVSPQSVQKMHELGYEPLPEETDGKVKWCFKPKTYFLEPVSNSYKLAEEDAADVRPVARGRWVRARGSYCTPGGDPVWECSECGKGTHVYGIEHGTYGADVSDGQWVACPNCGADMRESPKDES